jgi:hypothetical protein
VAEAPRVPVDSVAQLGEMGLRVFSVDYYDDDGALPLISNFLATFFSRLRVRCRSRDTSRLGYLCA